MALPPKSLAGSARAGAALSDFSCWTFHVCITCRTLLLRLFQWLQALDRRNSVRQSTFETEVFRCYCVDPRNLTE